jgi:hypothetical protein
MWLTAGFLSISKTETREMTLNKFHLQGVKKAGIVKSTVA